MDELEIVREKAVSLIRESGEDLAAMERGLRLLKDAEETQTNRTENLKLRAETSQSAPLRYLNVLAPFATVSVLAGTLYFQVHQFQQTEKNRIEEREDGRWADTLKSVSERGAKDDIAAIIALKSFLKSERYRDDAGRMVLRILRHTKSVEDFKELFLTQYPVVGWEDLNSVLDVDRALVVAWNDAAGDTVTQEKIIKELSFIGVQIYPALKKRPAGAPLDLHSVSFFDCDFSWINLSGANLDGFTPGRVRMDHTDLSGVPNANYGSWKDTAWWKAEKISPDLLRYLKATAPLDNRQYYGANVKLNIEEYQADVKRLSQQQ